ncbi:hypothetical protein HDU93_000300 [Gonapodya sp. JEL0774]|nr:hypothetical protein HDU93_000300 [Gonapodya sp. JEL0774]
MFGEYGPLEKAVILRDAVSGRSKKYGFVYMDNIDDAIKAKEALNDKASVTGYPVLESLSACFSSCRVLHPNSQEFNDRRMRVDYSLTAGPHAATPGQYMGRPTAAAPGTATAVAAATTTVGVAPPLAGTETGAGTRITRETGAVAGIGPVVTAPALAPVTVTTSPLDVTLAPGRETDRTGPKGTAVDDICDEG